MPSDTCDTCTDYLCPIQGKDDTHKCSAFAIHPNDCVEESERQKAIIEMRVEKGKELCKSKRTIIFKNGERLVGPAYFSQKEYMLIEEATHFLPRLHTRKFRPALEINFEHDRAHFQIIILSEGELPRW